MPRKDRPTGPMTARAARRAASQSWLLAKRRADWESLEHFKFGGAMEFTMSGTELLRGHGITEADELKAFGGPCTFFQNVNCGSGVIRR